jgi:hypothetical protein
MMRGQITDLEAIRTFVLAGDATFTLVSKRTGARRTFRVRETGDNVPTPVRRFVDLLVGPENTSDFHYLCFLHERDGTLNLKPNKHGWGDEAFRALEWMVRRINERGEALLRDAEFWHEGRCGRCGRALTVPESIASGIGPVCAGRGDLR